MANHLRTKWARSILLATALVALALAPASVRAGAGREPFYSDGPDTSATVRESLELCDSLLDHPGTVQEQMADRGLRLAERALADEPRDARAHFAVFCHLGRRAERKGVSLDSFSTVNRARAELERALELEPNYVDALVGEGAMLIELPWFLGGDEDRGEELLRRALALDGGFEPARTRLAAFLEDQGRLDEMPVRVALHDARTGG